MVFSRKLDKPTTLEREYREEANSTNLAKFIRVIRRLAHFALMFFLSGESHVQCAADLTSSLFPRKIIEI